MKVDNNTSQNFKSNNINNIHSNPQTNFISQSPSTIIKQLSNKMFELEPIKQDYLSKGLQSNNSFTKLRPDSQPVQWQTQFNAYQSPSTIKPLTKLSNNQQSSNYINTNLYGKGEQSKSSLDKSIEYSLMKIQNQSLKSDNNKLSESVNKLRKQLQQKVSTLNKFNQLMKIKYNQLKQLKISLDNKQLQIQQLQNDKLNYVTKQQASKLKQLLIKKNNQLHSINHQINNLQHNNFKNQVFQMKINQLYDQLEQEKIKNNNYFIENSSQTQKIKQLQQQISILQFENQKKYALNKVTQIQQIQNLFKHNQSSPSKANKQSAHLTAFQEALRVQMKQIQELKQVIENSSEVVQKLKDNLITSRRQLQELRGQMKIFDLKANSQRKKLIMEYRLQIHQKDNQINSAFKKYKTLQEKYKNSLLDIKAKDDFFRQHLVGRITQTTIQEYIESILNKYTQSFDDIMTLKAQNESLKNSLQRYHQYEDEAQWKEIPNC